MAQQPRNFLKFQPDFEKETGLKLKDNIPAYIQYSQLRHIETFNHTMSNCGNAIINNLATMRLK